MTKSELSKRAASRLRDKWAKFVKKGRKKGLHNNGNIYCIPGPHMYPITGACSVMR